MGGKPHGLWCFRAQVMGVKKFVATAVTRLVYSTRSASHGKYLPNLGTSENACS